MADLYPVPEAWAKRARVNAEKYAQLYGREYFSLAASR